MTRCAAVNRGETMVRAIIVAAVGAFLMGGCSGTGELSPSPSGPAPLEPTSPEASPAPTSPPVARPSRAAKPTGIGTYESNVSDYSIVVRDVMARYQTPVAHGAGFASSLEIEL